MAFSKACYLPAAALEADQMIDCFSTYFYFWRAACLPGCHHGDSEIGSRLAHRASFCSGRPAATFLPSSFLLDCCYLQTAAENCCCRHRHGGKETAAARREEGKKPNVAAGRKSSCAACLPLHWEPGYQAGYRPYGMPYHSSVSCSSAAAILFYLPAGLHCGAWKKNAGWLPTYLLLRLSSRLQGFLAEGVFWELLEDLAIGIVCE